MDVFEKVADVLDALALELETSHVVKTATPVAAPAAFAPRPGVKLAAAIKAQTGDDVTPEYAEQVATDPVLARLIQKLAKDDGERTPLGSAEDVGGASERTADDASDRARAERTKDAWDKFGSYLVG